MGIGQTLQQHEGRLEPHQGQDLLDRVVRNGRRLNELLTDLLDLRRIQEGATGISLAPEHLPDLFRSALADVNTDQCVVHIDVPQTSVNIDVPGRVGARPSMSGWPSARHGAHVTRRGLSTARRSTPVMGRTARRRVVHRRRIDRPRGPRRPVG